MRTEFIGLMALTVLSLNGQTRIDLKNQAKQVDFTSATATRPLKMGTTLPATCVQGDLFFKSDAAAGANIYGCVAANTWTAQASINQAGVQIEVDGVSVGTRAIENIASGDGIVNTVIDTGDAIIVQHNVDSAFMETRANQQAGGTLLCASSSASATVYTCSLNPFATSYTRGMLLHWIPDVNGSGGATTLEVDGLGSQAVKLQDGTDPTGADIVAGTLHEIWYDGTSFRILAPSTRVAVSPTRPACTVSLRGRLWFALNGAGSADTFAVCAKDASAAYAWRALY